MSIVKDHVRRLDAQVERISLLPLVAVSSDGVSDEPGREEYLEILSKTLSSPRFNDLLRTIRALSPASSSRALLLPNEIKKLLLQSGMIGEAEAEESKNHYEVDVEWLLVSKATVQTYGIILNALLDQIIPLSDEIWYWDEVLGSYFNSSLYTIQTSPIRMWDSARDVYQESLERLQRLQHRQRGASLLDQAIFEDFNGDEAPRNGLAQEDGQTPSLSQRWRRFYTIVREGITERSVTDIQRRVLSPVAICRSQARRKQSQLRKLRDITAAGLGILLDEGLSFGSDEAGHGAQEWKGLVERNVALMDVVLKKVLLFDVGLHDFEDKVFAGVEDDPELSVHVDDTNITERPRVIASRLFELLQRTLPEHAQEVQHITSENGRPSWLVRYWLPALVLFASSSTLLRLLSTRYDDIMNWIRDFGATARDFWLNWVVDPVRKIVGTIRHEASSEIALMSRDSLRADRESLERMVVEFSIDRPQIAAGSSALTESQIAGIRAKVKEGDVTPVLKAFERDLRTPFKGAVRGDLVRSLLIQVQKTKVDLEVAISGIDALLKSQELVFGFIGLTPGVLVSICILQYLRTLLDSRKGTRQGRRARRGVRVLRRIDRILSDATPTTNNVISYKDHGLLVCEVHVLRQLANGLLPRDVEKEFIEDLDELANLKGIQVQMRALERIRWAYAEWLSRMQ